MPPMNPDDVLRQVQEGLHRQRNGSATLPGVGEITPMPDEREQWIKQQADMQHQHEEARIRELVAQHQPAISPEPLRSLEAENALRAEVQLYRERYAQVLKQQEEERKQLLLGLQRLLEPLVSFWTEVLHLPTQPTTVITDTIQLLRKYREALLAPTSTPQSATSAAPTSAWEERLARLEAMIASLVRPMPPTEQAPRVPSVPQPPADGWGSFIVTDQRAYQIEQELMAQQKREALWHRQP